MKLRTTFKMWQSLPEELDPDGTGAVEIKAFNEGDNRAVQDHATEMTATLDPNASIETQEGRAKALRPMAKFNQSKWAEKFALLRITDWRGFYDANGNSLPCTNANKLLFAAEDGFIDWLSERARLIDAHAKNQLDEQEKNSLYSRVPSSESDASETPVKRAGKRSASS